jgi:hypothetical protein
MGSLLLALGVILGSSINEPHQNPESKHAAARPGRNDVRRIIRRLYRGDTSVVREAFEIGSSLDAGALLEDLSTALGCVATRHPRLFLEEAKRQALSAVELQQIVVALPVDVVVDNMDLRLKLLRERDRQLASITEPALIGIRDSALAGLRAEIEEVEAHVPSK